MNAIFTFNKKDIKNIITGKKMLFFGHKISKKIQQNTIIFLSDGQKVIGECQVKERVPLGHYKFGAYPFMLHFAKYIKKDNYLEEAIKKIYDYDLPMYNPAYKLDFIYLYEYLDFVKKGDFFYTFNMSKKEQNEYIRKQQLGTKIINDCDKWLKEIGYYNENDESFYKEYIEIESVKLYNIPKNLDTFLKKNGEPFTKSPKTYALCK